MAGVTSTFVKAPLLLNHIYSPVKEEHSDRQLSSRAPKTLLSHDCTYFGATFTAIQIKIFKYDLASFRMTIPNRNLDVLEHPPSSQNSTRVQRCINF